MRVSEIRVKRIRVNQGLVSTKNNDKFRQACSRNMFGNMFT